MLSNQVEGAFGSSRNNVWKFQSASFEDCEQICKSSFFSLHCLDPTSIYSSYDLFIEWLHDLTRGVLTPSDPIPLIIFKSLLSWDMFLAINLQVARIP